MRNPELSLRYKNREIAKKRKTQRNSKEEKYKREFVSGEIQQTGSERDEGGEEAKKIQISLPGA